MPQPLVADRFVANGASWIDLATGQAVRLRIAPAGDRRAQFRWCERCAAYATLRHPLLNPLLDYGALDRNRVFEAYAAGPPLATTKSSAGRGFAHAMQFLRAHGVDPAAEQSAFARRMTTAGPPLRTRPCGIVLQDRATLSAVGEALDATSPGGPGLITVAGPPASGLRTIRVQIARAARLRGFVPVASSVLVTCRWLTDALVERHVCLLADAGRAGARDPAAAGLLAALGRASARRHMVIVFTRDCTSGPTVIPLQPMGARAMTSMVFVDARGPSASELFDAARASDGRPGIFLDRLGAARAFERHVPNALVAHEAAEPYGDPAPDESRAPSEAIGPSRRLAGALARAVERADALAARGRHAAAARLLMRARRVLSGRGETLEAALCAVRLGRLHLSRGQASAAANAFDAARAAGARPDVARLGTLGLAAAWIDDGRLVPAEALLRSAVVAAELAQRPDSGIACALARCLYWQGRYGEALAALRPHLDEASDAACLALAARVHLADGVVPAGVQLARRAAQQVSAAGGDAAADVERALAAALAAAGDRVAALEHVGLALEAARRARRPLDAIRARILRLTVLAQMEPEAPWVRRLADRLRVVDGRLRLPRLLRFQLQKTVEYALGTPPNAATLAIEAEGARWPRPRSHATSRTTELTELETMLEICHGASDDREALDRLCAASLERMRAAATAIVCAAERRLRGHSGRPWDGQSQAVARALAAEADARPEIDSSSGRYEAAEPVKFSGEVIGAVACRWVPGTAFCPDRAAATLKAAALAAAAPLRAVLDRVAPEDAAPGGSGLLGESAGAIVLRDAIARAARAPYPVLVQGESGSGKELVARAVHRLGPRRDRRFCAVNCAALSDELLEAELFGHTRGAFTGAVTERAGLFEEADGGTLFLDEIGELSPRAQAKLLRVLQEGEIRRVGESFSRRVDVRIVAATNRQLEQEAAAGRFRMDLRFRLDVIRLVVPPLRERVADIPMLAAHFWSDAAQRVGSRATLSPDALAALSRYDWPGNVRELQNVIAWLAVHSPRRGRIGAAGLPTAIAGVIPPAPMSFEAAREEFERRFIRSALARANGHRANAAESLGITRQGLAKMMRRLRIDDRPWAG